MRNQFDNNPASFHNDENWILSTIYYNPEDPRTSVPRRSGFGLTLNFARPDAYLVVSIPLIIGAAIVLCVAFA